MSQYIDQKTRDQGLKKLLGDDNYSLFIHLFNSGVNTTNIAKALNCSRYTVKQYIEMYEEEKNATN